MSADLQDLFDQAGRNPPDRAWDVDAVLRRARRARDRRITGAVAATVALTLAMVVGGLASHRLLSSDPAPAAPRPPTAPVPIPPVPGSLGKLAYVSDGDIYVADPDGSNPVRIADGAADERGCANYWAEGPMWSPDGRYLAYRGPATGGDRAASDCSVGETVYISDSTGRRLTSFPAEGWSVAWSPDSTRVAVWVKFGGNIGIFGLDGVRRALLTLAPECSLGGDFDPVWSPDGASLLITKGCEIPVDGSAPRQLPPDDPRSQVFAEYSPDATKIAFISQDGLAVADADGSQVRVLVPGALEVWGPGPYRGPLWSPTGDRIAFVIKPIGRAEELRVVDVESRTVVSLADLGGRGDASVLGYVTFSPEGDQILFTRPDGEGGYSLWSVHADGSDAHRLVKGAFWGDWQKLIPAR